MIYRISQFNIVDIILVAAAIVPSIVLHELAHGYVAKWNGDYTAQRSGRLKFNPLVHFDIIGFFMLLVAGIGFAKPVPVNPYNFRNRKKGIFTVAIAGVVVNFTLAFFAFGFIGIFGVVMTQAPSLNALWGYFRDFFSYLCVINLNLFFFNLIPIHPLDGFRIIEAFTKPTNRAVRFFQQNGKYFLLALIGLGVLVSIFEQLGFPAWISYFDIIGTYLGYCNYGVQWVFSKCWWFLF